MADSFSPNLNLRKPEVGAAHDTWGGVAGLNGDLDLIDAVFLATGLGTSVGIHVGTGKVANIEGTLLVADPTDTSAGFRFDASDITTATIRTLKAPDASGTLALKEYVAPTGTVLSGYFGSVAPAGFVFLCGRTIGDAASGATERANADTANLYTLFWTLGFTPTGGRGASAAADYAAHKPMALPDHRGRVMAARDNLGGTAAGILSGYTAVGVAGGEQTHTLTVAELASHTHAAGSSVVVASGANYTVPALGPLSYSTEATGGNVAHNNIQPTIAVDAVIAL